MSRSFKKHPWVTDHKAGTTRKSKRVANKVVRHEEDIPNGKAYKKAHPSYNICYDKGRWTWEDAKASWEKEENFYLKRRYPTLKAYYRYWLKCSKTK